MRRARHGRGSLRAAFTLVELLLALGLLSILVLALVRLLDTSLTIWGRTEANRDLDEMGGDVLDLFVEDFHGLEGGPRGDLLGEWVRFDTDRDGTKGALMPRVRLVRQASPADLLRLRPGTIPDARARGLLEIAWALLPPKNAEEDERSVGILWRGVRPTDDVDSLSFLDGQFFDSAGKPVPGSMDIVTGGVLWLDVWYASQTSVVHDGWSLGTELSDCAAAWDAWGLSRPDTELTYLNAPAGGMREAEGLPVLPRRVRIELEIERPSELRRRTRLQAEIDPEATELLVGDERRVPQREDAMIKIDEEWMRVLSTSRGRLFVSRGQRGTRPAVHVAGTIVHYGSRIAREVPIAMAREDWDL